VPVGGRPGSDIRSVVELGQRAERAGFDGVVVVDHVVMSEHTDDYPFGEFRFAADSAWIEPLIALTAVATATARIELISSILVASVRSPGVLAKQVATLDQLAPGRLVLGVGAGWLPAEFPVNRVAHKDRGRLLDDTMRACRALWTQSPASLNAPTLSFDRLWCEPRTSAGPPPILVGAAPSVRTARRIAEWGDGWMPDPRMPDDKIAAGVGRLRRWLDDAGRDGSRLAVHAMRCQTGTDGRGDLRATIERLGEWSEIGITSVALPLAMFVDGPDDWDDWFAEVAALLVTARS
jgi:probable F420-dependent oxidoreductase